MLYFFVVSKNEVDKMMGGGGGYNKRIQNKEGVNRNGREKVGDK